MVADELGLTADFQFRVLGLAFGWAELELDYAPTMVRPGGTISGPTLFSLVDLTLFAAVLTTVGLEPMAVTSELAIHFLRPPAPRTMRATAEILRAGRRTVHGDVRVYTVGDETPVCHASGSYAVPDGSRPIELGEPLI